MRLSGKLKSSVKLASFSTSLASLPLNAAALALSFSLVAPSALASTEALTEQGLHAQAQDPRYGEALYFHHQGEFFEALTRLNVAKQQGGVKGHGDHPLLLEGGLMLSYGMTREAKKLFESLLQQASVAQVSPQARTQAWFYLAKVFYLEGDYPAAQAALSKLEAQNLASSTASDKRSKNAALLDEMHYLQHMLAIKLGQPCDACSEQTEPTKHQNLWSVYSAYNQILATLSASGKFAPDHIDDAITALAQLLTQTQALYAEQVDLLNQTEDLKQVEHKALIDRMQLSLAQLYAQTQRYAEAKTQLQQVRLDGPHAEQALFQYAVVNSHLGAYNEALAALNELQARSSFSPWLQQAPYALAYLYERMGDKAIALQAYAAAAEHYQQSLNRLEQAQADLSEQSLLAGLEVMSKVEASAEVEQGTDVGNEEEQAPLTLRAVGARAANTHTFTLGQRRISNDAYGRLALKPKRFELVELLASESFQFALRDLHELYKLKASLTTWQQQLAAFDTMLATRAKHRDQRLAEVAAQLDELYAANWQRTLQAYEAALAKADREQDAHFYINDEQLEFVELLADIEADIERLPEGDQRDEFLIKYLRAQQYFDWWLADTYGPNRWAAHKQLRQMQAAMAEFEQRSQRLNAELSNSDFQAQLKARVQQGREQVAVLSLEIEQGLAQQRDILLGLAKAEYQRQSSELKRYRLATRHAQARLADELYRSKLDLELARQKEREQASASSNSGNSSNESDNQEPTPASAEVSK